VGQTERNGESEGGKHNKKEATRLEGKEVDRYSPKWRRWDGQQANFLCAFAVGGVDMIAVALAVVIGLLFADVLFAVVVLLLVLVV